MICQRPRPEFVRCHGQTLARTGCAHRVVGEVSSQLSRHQQGDSSRASALKPAGASKRVVQVATADSTVAQTSSSSSLSTTGRQEQSRLWTDDNGRAIAPKAHVGQPYLCHTVLQNGRLIKLLTSSQTVSAGLAKRLHKLRKACVSHPSTDASEAALWLKQKLRGSLSLYEALAAVIRARRRARPEDMEAVVAVFQSMAFTEESIASMILADERVLRMDAKKVKQRCAILQRLGWGQARILERLQRRPQLLFSPTLPSTMQMTVSGATVRLPDRADHPEWMKNLHTSAGQLKRPATGTAPVQARGEMRRANGARRGWRGAANGGGRWRQPATSGSATAVLERSPANTGMLQAVWRHLGVLTVQRHSMQQGVEITTQAVEVSGARLLLSGFVGLGSGKWMKGAGTPRSSSRGGEEVEEEEDEEAEAERLWVWQLQAQMDRIPSTAGFDVRQALRASSPGCGCRAWEPHTLHSNLLFLCATFGSEALPKAQRDLRWLMFDQRNVEVLIHSLMEWLDVNGPAAADFQKHQQLQQGKMRMLQKALLKQPENLLVQPVTALSWLYFLQRDLGFLDGEIIAHFDELVGSLLPFMHLPTPLLRMADSARHPDGDADS